MKHGSPWTYFGGVKCRCELCREAAIEYNRQLRRRKAYGRFERPYVPVDRARARIEALRSIGMSFKQIAKMCGVAEPTIYSTVQGYAKTRDLNEKATIHRESEQKILNAKLNLSVMNPRAMLSTRGFVRRYQALARIGYRSPDIAKRLGMADDQLRHILQQDRVQVYKYRQMVKIYAELCDHPAKAQNGYLKGWIERQKREAREKGWAHPFDWENIDFDDQPHPDASR